MFFFYHSQPKVYNKCSFELPKLRFCRPLHCDRLWNSLLYKLHINILVLPLFLWPVKLIIFEAWDKMRFNIYRELDVFPCFGRPTESNKPVVYKKMQQQKYVTLQQ